MGIISVLAVFFLREYGVAIAATLCVITFLATNTKTTKIDPPATSISSPSTAVTAPPADPEPQKPAANIDNESSYTYALRTCGKTCMKATIRALDVLLLQTYCKAIVIPLGVVTFFATNRNKTETSLPAIATNSQPAAVTPLSSEMPAYPEPQKPTASSKKIDNENSDICDLGTCGQTCMDEAVEATQLVCILDSCECCLAYASVHLSNV